MTDTEPLRLHSRINEASHAQLIKAAEVMVSHADPQGLRNLLETAPLYMDEEVLTQIKAALTGEGSPLTEEEMSKNVEAGFSPHGKYKG